MSRKLHLIRCDEHGSTVVELAFALPVLASLLYGIGTIGMFFEANAGIQHALGQAARYGNLCLADTSGTCTLPKASDIKQKVSDNLYGAASSDFDAPTVDTSKASSGGYVTVTVTYHHTLSFLFFNGPTETLTRSKRVYLAQTPPTQTTCTNATTPPDTCKIYS